MHIQIIINKFGIHIYQYDRTYRLAVILLSPLAVLCELLAQPEKKKEEAAAKIIITTTSSYNAPTQ